MRKYFFALFAIIAVTVYATNPVPDVGNGRIRVVGNNLLNYYYNYNTGRGDYTEAERAEKTHKIVVAMVQANADIFAFCEVEAQPIVLQQLADSMNAYAGVAGRYAAVDDGISEEWDSYYNNNIKSGFIYRTDKVEPYYSDYPATNQTYYKNVMRIQAWEELATGERFTLSMNHFKAKSDEASIAKRVDNANWLLSALGNSSKVKDPDILIMGDLNAQMDEEALQNILNGGFVEQLLRYNANAYSYCYQGNKELIDHAFANASMAGQITGAAVWHINTSCGSGDGGNYYTRYSDHDPYLVAMNLGDAIPGDCESISFTETFGASLGQFTTESVDPSGSATWFWNSQYSCANINAYNKGANEDYLISPAFDFTDQKSGTMVFQHAQAYGSSSNWASQCQLLISDDYTNDVVAATWTPLTIPNWSSSNYEFVNNSIDIPASFMRKSNVHFAFYYNVGESNAPAWEIKNVTLTTVCEKAETAVENVQDETPRYKKILHNGQLLIERDGVQYTITGQRLY